MPPDAIPPPTSTATVAFSGINFGEGLRWSRAARAVLFADVLDRTLMNFCNGIALRPDGRALIIAETFGFRLTSFAVDPDTGRLSDRAVWAETPGCMPDGICMDKEGGVWVANAIGTTLPRIAQGGGATRTVTTSLPSFSVALAGEDGGTLVIATAPSDFSRGEGEKPGRIEVCRVDVPAA
ncbi:hypothetical protein DFJ74DRAFT_713299 [Hyaloraphidium curvatum]|nr:hypothetical protein DFJ74DRAFT_713299 [Hyaloraphidium curvatum]